MPAGPRKLPSRPGLAGWPGAVGRRRGRSSAEVETVTGTVSTLFLDLS
jgi:hypothetical protein